MAGKLSKTSGRGQAGYVAVKNKQRKSQGSWKNGEFER